MSKKNIAILIGAGAEGKTQYNLITGSDFKIETVKCSNTIDFIKRINKNIKIDNEDIFENIKNGKLFRKNSSNILYQSCKELLVKSNNDRTLEDFCNNFDKLLIEEGLNQEGFSSKNIINEYIEYRDGKYKNEDKDKEIIKTNFLNLYRNLYYLIDKFYGDKARENVVESPKEKDTLDEIIKNLSFYSNIDESFNYLRYPNVYKTECSLVLKLYYSAYRSIMSQEEGMNIFTDKEQKNDNKELTSTYYRQELDTIYKNFINKKIDATDTYYNIIKKKLSSDHNTTINCITLNYTTILDETLKGLKNSKIYHIHGQMNYFEDLKTKRIGPLNEFIDCKDSIIFPYILIQSGIKPIISKYEIEQFYGAVSSFTNASKIIVIGYSMCSDDEHITNLLRDSFLEGKSQCVLYFLIYSKDYNEYKKRVDNTISILNIFNNTNLIDDEYEIKGKKIIFKYINDSNSTIVFKEILDC